MRKSLLAVFLVIVSAPALAVDKPELTYDGKSLSYWVTRFQKAETAEQRENAAQAIQAFGVDAAPAVPALIGMLSDLSPSFRYEVAKLLGKLGPIAKDARPVLIKLRQDEKIDFSLGVADAFVAICPEPKDAIPVLVQILDSLEAAERDHVVDVSDGSSVCLTLCNMGPVAKDAIPAIRRYLLSKIAKAEKDKKAYEGWFYPLPQLGPDVVPFLVELFDAYGGHARLYAIKYLEQLGPNASKAGPALVKLLKHKDGETRYHAAALLWKLEKHPDVVPTLARLVGTEIDITVAMSRFGPVGENASVDAANMLGEIGPDAKVALPALRDAVRVGLPASVMAGAYYQLACGKGGFLKHEEYEISLRFQALVAVAEAAANAIDQIEGKAKK